MQAHGLARLFGGVVLAIACLACGPGPVSIGGRIVDHTGSPVAKAEVTTVPETDVVMTNSRGFFMLRQRINDMGETEPLPPGVYQIEVRKFGFMEFAFEAKVDGGPVRVQDLVLQPRTPDIGDAAPDVMQEAEMAPDEGSVPKTGI